jgi:hypothetical protein
MFHTRLTPLAAARQRTLLGLTILACLLVPYAAGQAPHSTVELLRAGPTFELRCAVQFAADDLVFDQRLGYDIVRLVAGGATSEPGHPALPTWSAGIAVPAGMVVTGVRVVDSEFVELPGEYLIMPAQWPQRVSQRSAPLEEPDAAAYAAADPYPGRLAEFTHQADLAGQNIAFVRFYPLQYTPADQRLVLHTSIEVILEGHAGYEHAGLPARTSARSRQMYQQMVDSLVVNPHDVTLRTEPTPAVSRSLPAGNYEYVIITQSSWVSYFQPLADWKTRKGVPALIVDTGFINGAYGGATAPERIKAFIMDAHNTWGTPYFMLGGDTNVVPAGTREMTVPGHDPDLIPNDTFYADFGTNYICNVNVGRASVRSAAQLSAFINKILTYERTPPSGNYATSAAFFGFDLHSLDSGEGEACKTTIRSSYVPETWLFNREYDSEAGGHKNDVLAYLNQGHHLVNHIDHSFTTSMGAGSTNHYTYIYNSDVGALTNGNKQSIVKSVGCWACDFDNSTNCIAEAFIRNPGGGAIAFIGNSRYGWYYSFSGDGLSQTYDQYFFKSIMPPPNGNGIPNLGAAFSTCKNDAYATDPTATMRYIFVELTLLGDPELPVWSAEPQELIVTHDDILTVNVFTTFPVQVADADGPLPGATVCLWKGDEVYEIAQTNGSGVATFWFAPTSEGEMFVTAGKQNYLPYQGQAFASDGSGPYVLTVLIEGHGTVTLDPDQQTYEFGTPVQVEALPATQWCLSHWSGALAGSDNPQTLTMSGNRILTAHFLPDCNENGIPDNIDILSGTSQDCNANGIPDECDIAAGTSEDCQSNGIPDECDLAPPTYVEAADDVEDALIVCPPTVYYGTTELATNDGSATCGYSSSSPDVWYFYEPFGSGMLTVSLCGSDFDTVLSVYRDTGGGPPGTQIACNDNYCGVASQVTVFVTHGNHYYIRISGNYGDTGLYQMVLTGPTCGYSVGDEDGDGIPDECQKQCLQTADSNCDGFINAFDIDPFVIALTDPDLWRATYNCDFLCANDCNGDGVVNSFDIDPFVVILTGGRP